MNLKLTAQLFGVVAVIFSLSVFQVNKRSLMLWLGLAAGALYTVHFFLLGAATGAAMNLIGIGRSYTFVKIKPNKGNTWVLLLFIAASGIATIITWQGIISLLAFAGNTVSGVAFWQRQPSSIRRWALISPPLWFTYNGLSGSYPGMFIEVFNLASVLTGQYRFDARHKSHIKRHLVRPA